MVVITMTCCPPKLRGDLSKWLCEINTGVYVGQVNARVRDALWQRVCENIAGGKATMVYSTNNEQHMEFRTYNSEWLIKDYDGLKLILRPNAPAKLPDVNTEELKPGFSKASCQLKARNKKNRFQPDRYAFLDIETTGLNINSDSIIEIGVIYNDNRNTNVRWSRLIKINGLVPQNITKLTGISNQMLEKRGVEIAKALKELSEIIAQRTLICYNAGFDITFLQKACEQNRIEFEAQDIIDVLPIARSKIDSDEI